MKKNKSGRIGRLPKATRNFAGTGYARWATLGRLVSVCAVLFSASHVDFANAQAADPLGEQEQRRRAQEQAIERERAINAPNVALQPVERPVEDDGKPGANPDIKINGQVADVYSPTSGNLQTIRDTVTTKVGTQAPNVVINLADSSLTDSQVVQYLQRNPVAGLNSVTVIKNGVVAVIGK